MPRDTGHIVAIEKLGPIHKVSLSPCQSYANGQRWMVTVDKDMYAATNFIGAMRGLAILVWKAIV